MKHPFSASIGDAGIDEAVRVVAQLPPFREPPVKGTIDRVAATGADLATWPTALLETRNEGRFDWPEVGDVRPLASLIRRIDPARLVFQAAEAFETLDQGIGWIEALPFEVCSVGMLYPEEWAEKQVTPYSFGLGHVTHGWACAFRGNGHQRLVSRRWLDAGPWRVIRRAGDLTVVQFHDLAADPDTAAEQALPAWERMGISLTGGFLQVPYVFHHDVEGLYIAETRTLEIVVPPNGAVDQLQMRDACAVRTRHGHVPADRKPIDQVAYVFLEPADARAHLHEMWLRELEVWQVDQSGKRRLDLEYQPVPPAPPAWVAAVDAG